MLQLTCARTCKFVSYYFSNVCGFNLYKWQLLISTIKYSSILLHLPVPLTDLLLWVLVMCPFLCAQQFRIVTI